MIKDYEIEAYFMALRLYMRYIACIYFSLADIYRKYFISYTRSWSNVCMLEKLTESTLLVSLFNFYRPWHIFTWRVESFQSLLAWLCLLLSGSYILYRFAKLHITRNEFDFLSGDVHDRKSYLSTGTKSIESFITGYMKTKGSPSMNFILTMEIQLNYLKIIIYGNINASVEIGMS